MFHLSPVLARNLEEKDILLRVVRSVIVTDVHLIPPQGHHMQLSQHLLVGCLSQQALRGGALHRMPVTSQRMVRRPRSRLKESWVSRTSVLMGGNLMFYCDNQKKQKGRKVVAVFLCQGKGIF
jgi:hypothetical protein